MRPVVKPSRRLMRDSDPLAGKYLLPPAYIGQSANSIADAGPSCGLAFAGRTTRLYPRVGRGRCRTCTGLPRSPSPVAMITSTPTIRRRGADDDAPAVDR